MLADFDIPTLKNENEYEAHSLKQSFRGSNFVQMAFFYKKSHIFTFKLFVLNFLIGKVLL